MGFLDDVVGGVSGAVGGVVGKFVGGLGSGADQTGYQATSPGLEDDQARRARFAQALANSQTRTGPQDQYRQMQTQGIQGLQQAANGQGPSAAQAMFRQAQDQNIANAHAQAASARGDVNPGMLQRNAMMSAANGNQALTQQSAALQAQEQLNARAQLAQALGQARGQDLQVQGQNDDLATRYEMMGLNADQAKLQAAMDAQRLNAGVAVGNTQGRNQLAGGIISGMSAGGASAMPMMAAASDENLKTDIKGGGKDVGKFLDALKAHTYKYKDESFGKGSQTSVMAQELERTPVGKAMVVNTPSGKMVDYGKGFGAILAAQADLHGRMKKMEGKK